MASCGMTEWRKRRGTATLPRRPLVRICAAALVVAAVTTGGCSGLSGSADGDIQSGLGCVDDSHACVDQRASALRTLTADPHRKWMREPAGPEAYASGVRMYAYKQKKRDLTCDELTLARREAEAAPGVLRGAGSQKLTPAQISRGVLFSADVARELASEQRRRCKV